MQYPNTSLIYGEGNERTIQNHLKTTKELNHKESNIHGLKCKEYCTWNIGIAGRIISIIAGQGIGLYN